MNNEELRTFVRLFDTAMTSDNPTVKKAFKNLMIVSALVNAETPEFSKGPFESMVDDLYTRISLIEKQLQITVEYYKPQATTSYLQTTNGGYNLNSLPPIAPSSTFVDDFFYNTMAHNTTTGNI